MPITATLRTSGTDASDQFFGGIAHGYYETAAVNLVAGRLYLLAFMARSRFGIGTLGPDPVQTGANWDLVEWIRFGTPIGSGNASLFIWQWRWAHSAAPCAGNERRTGHLDLVGVRGVPQQSNGHVRCRRHLRHQRGHHTGDGLHRAGRHDRRHRSHGDCVRCDRNDSLRWFVGKLQGRWRDRRGDRTGRWRGVDRWQRAVRDARALRLAVNDDTNYTTRTMSFPVVYTPEPTRPSGGPQPGTRILLEWIVSPDGWDAADAFDDQDPVSLGIYNPRDVCGNQWPNWECTGSQHASGRAGDAGFPVVLPGGHAEGHKLANWLVANHEALGIQEVIWAERRWHNGLGIIPHAQWPMYTGRSKHYDHVHFAQNDAGARGLTLAMIEAVAPTPEPQLTNDEDTDMIVLYSGARYLLTNGRLVHLATQPDIDKLKLVFIDAGRPLPEWSVSRDQWRRLVTMFGRPWTADASQPSHDDVVFNGWPTAARETV